MRLIESAEHHVGFLMGLVSHALLDIPLDDALRQVGVATAISDPLLGRTEDETVFRTIYKLVCHSRRY